jgi:hypothetical protein
MALHNIQLGILNQNKQTGSSSPRRPAACAVQPRAFNFDKTPASSRASASASISGTPPVLLSPFTLSSLTASPSAPLPVPLASSHPTSTQDATLSPILAPHPTPRPTRPASSSTPQLSPRDPRSLAMSLSSHPAPPLVAGPTPRPVPQASSHHPTPRSLPGATRTFSNYPVFIDPQPSEQLVIILQVIRETSSTHRRYCFSPGDPRSRPRVCNCSPNYHRVKHCKMDSAKRLPRIVFCGFGELSYYYAFADEQS